MPEPISSPTTSPAQGRFIVLEGIDGCGSTTQVARLALALRARGHQTLATCEPSKGPVGTWLRGVLEGRIVVPGTAERWQPGWATLALMFAADRLDHLDSIVLPTLQAGTTVVSDRFDLSSLAYQSVTAGEDARVVPWIRQINAHARRPDLTVVLDVPLEEATRRRHARGGSEELFDADPIQRQLVGAYARAEQLVPGDLVVHVSGVGPVEEVTERLLSVVLAGLPEL